MNTTSVIQLNRIEGGYFCSSDIKLADISMLHSNHLHPFTTANVIIWRVDAAITLLISISSIGASIH